jgi:hypothetical protein
VSASSDDGDAASDRHNAAMSPDARPWPGGWSTRTRLAVWLVGSGVGVAIVALPDSDDRVLSLSRTHGLAAVDLVGLVVLLAGWLPVPALLWARRRALAGPMGRTALVLAVGGALGLAVTVGLDLGWTYAVAVGALVLAQLLALRAVAGHRRADGADATGAGGAGTTRASR